VLTLSQCGAWYYATSSGVSAAAVGRRTPLNIDPLGSGVCGVIEMRCLKASRTVAVSLLAVASLAFGPCGPIPGSRLSGTDSSAPPADWSIANDVPRCAVEVRPGSPHSVTVNCMSWQGRLFVSCSECEPKTWSSYAVKDPHGRVQIGDEVYPVSLRRIVDPAELDSVWQARARKIGEGDAGQRPSDWWTFELTSR
jgi:hypothetical protein